ncbi:hypothetical protein FQN57_005227 [Myotisia sp. PD_48]|nr:hypothetical protein FQN57_005227 [Myotisia sp. PD_48]
MRSRTPAGPNGEGDRSRENSQDVARHRRAHQEPQEDMEISDERTRLLAGHERAGSISPSIVQKDVLKQGNTAQSYDFSSLPWWKRPSVFWVLPPLLLFTTAFGGVAVPKINLVLTLICRDYLSERSAMDPTFTHLPVVFGGENPQCRIPEIHARVSRFQLILNLVAGIFSAVVSPKMGHLSDGYGRTKIMGLSTLGTFLGETMTALVATFPDTFSVNVLIIGAFLDGILGSVTAAVALTQSYASDCTPPENRNVAFGYFHGVLFTGIAIGPLAAGYLIKYTGDVRLVFYAVLLCQIVFPIVVTFIVPESVTKERQKYNREKRNIQFPGAKNFRLSDLNPINLFKPLLVLFPAGDKTVSSTAIGKARMKKLQRNLIILAAIDTAIFGVAMGTMSTLILYAEYMFGWADFESSIFVSIVSTVRVIVLLVFLPTLTWFFRGRKSQTNDDQALKNNGSDTLDIAIIRVSILFDMLGYLGYCVVRTGSLMVLSGTVAAMAGMIAPTIQSTLTKHLPSDRTGQLLGAMGLLHALARVVAPTIFNLIYSFTVGTVPQAIWIGLASIIFLGFVASWFLVPHVYLPDSAIEHDETVSPAQDQDGEA